MRSFATLALLIAAVCAAPVDRRADIPSAAQIAALAPDLGATPPLAPTGFGDCQGPVTGSNGKPAAVPCDCPPTRDEFIKALTRDVRAGKAVNNPTVKVSFPTGNTLNDAHGRITASAITLQNLRGPGKGCPLVATTLGVQSKALDALAKQGVKTVDGNGSGVAAATPAAPASPATAATAKASATAKAATAKPATSTSGAASSSSSTKGGVPSAAQIAQLAPDLGVSAPLKPTGFGDCVGPNVNDAGKPINVPCSCPPSRDAFIKALTRDVQAGKAVNNPSVKISFPTGDSVQDKLGRINAAAVTLQNLEGPGKGCPFASTTLGKQAKALQGK